MSERLQYILNTLKNTNISVGIFCHEDDIEMINEITRKDFVEDITGFFIFSPQVA